MHKDFKTSILWSARLIKLFSIYWRELQIYDPSVNFSHLILNSHEKLQDEIGFLFWREQSHRSHQMLPFLRFAPKVRYF